MRNPYATSLGLGLPAGATPDPTGALMCGPVASRPVASAAHLGWLFYDETSRGLYACVYGSSGFEWVSVGGWVAAPASQTATGTVGQKAYDANYFYVCSATNSWKRVAWTPGDAW